MIEIFPSLYVGDQTDAAHLMDRADQPYDGWFIIHAAKEPWHRRALGYSTPGAPKTHFEYLIARRPNRLILNIVDVADPTYIRDEIIEAALEAIDQAINVYGKKVLIHCNQGQSRAPTIAMLWLKHHTDFEGRSHAEAVEFFKALYPPYAPAKGMAEWARQHWNDHVAGNL